jgi:RNA polymerase sigma-70 factor, ECF subfamily
MHQFDITYWEQQMNAGDQDVLVLLATDLRQAYELLISIYWHQLKSFVLHRWKSPQDADDIVQEAFVRAYYALETYSTQRIMALKLRPWLYKITWNVYCTYAERAKLQQGVPLDLSEESALLELEDDQYQQPEEVFENKERRRELAALVEMLPQRYRQIVSLHYLEDLSYQEIADTFNQSTGTVRVSVHRALSLLRKTVEAQGQNNAQLDLATLS